MEIKKMNVVELKAAEYNPRKDLKPGDKEFEKLKRSIEEFGYVEPIIWNSRTGNVVGGHQRLKVMKHLGYKEVDCVILDLDIQKEKALNIALNRISGEWDNDLLSALLKDLDNSGYDISLTGFDMSETNELFGSGSMENVKEDDFDEDEALANVKEPITKKGDLWILGNHRLLCGDSTSEADAKYVLDGNVADLMVTDPPYNVNYGSSVEYKANGGRRNNQRETSVIANDNMSDEDFYKFLLGFYTVAYASLKGGAPLYVFHSTKETINFTKAMLDSGFKYSQTLVWVKNHFTLGRQDYQHIFEPILYGWKVKDGSPHYFIDDRTQHSAFEDAKLDIKKLTKAELQELLEKILKLQTTVIYADKPSRSPDHPTTKPLLLCAKLIYNSSHEGDMVYEPFGGSGSTLIAAEQLNRKCCVIELEPKYCDVICRRFYQINPTAKVALIRDGKEVDLEKLKDK